MTPASTTGAAGRGGPAPGRPGAAGDFLVGVTGRGAEEGGGDGAARDQRGARLLRTSNESSASWRDQVLKVPALEFGRRALAEVVEGGRGVVGAGGV